jgi:Spy/CpxP family protein refolding chaperone
MRRFVFLSLILLVVGCASVFAQRGGGGAGGRGGGGNPPPMGRGSNEGGQNRNAGQGEVGQSGNRNAGERQDGAGNGQGQPRGAGRALRGLDLSDAQKQQIRDIENSARENGADRETVRNEIRSVLTAEQLEKLDAREAREREKREKRQQQNPGGTSQPNN